MPKAQPRALPEGFVRPRFDDGTFDEPLLLEDQFVERFMGPLRERTQLLLVGARGSGLTTTLEWLTELCLDPERYDEGLRRRIPITYETLCSDPDRALAILASRAGMLMLDMSINSLTPNKGRMTQLMMSVGYPDRPGSLEVLRAADMVVVGTPSPHSKAGLGQGWLWAPDLPRLERVRLAPWTSDDLLELLGSTEAYRARRGEVFSALQGIRQKQNVLTRPRTTRQLVEAALQLGEGEPVTLARLYANVLDTLSPWAIGVLRRMRHDDLRMPLLREALLEPIDDPIEATTLFELDADVAVAIHMSRELPLQVYDKVPLSLPGLHDFLQAGTCLEEVAKGQVPESVSPSWFPFLRELATPGHRRTLRRWLTSEAEAEIGEASAATILLGLGETPALDARRFKRHLQLAGAHLPKLDLPGAHLNEANLYDAVLSGARLEGAFIGKADLSAATCVSTSFAGAHMTRTRFEHAQMHRANLRGATLNHCFFHGTTLLTAELEGAHLLRARFEEADLTRANLARAHMEGALMRRCRLRETNLRGADLEWIQLDGSDLTSAHVDTDTRWKKAIVRQCDLGALVLDGDLEGAVFDGCDLSDTVFRGAHAPQAGFENSRMNNASFDGADLRGATFSYVTFHAGSSRAGLLQGGAAMEGSMSGYYVEGTSDDAWASPESIRQASFRGADLTDARFHETDLFRVDFRDAIMSDELREQARKSGAILDR